MAEVIELDKETRQAIRLEVKRAIYPKWIKGTPLASTMLDLSTEGLQRRAERGVYKEGEHYKYRSAKIVLWNRDALLKHEIERGKL